jgi:hypothetical protein
MGYLAFSLVAIQSPYRYCARPPAREQVFTIPGFGKLVVDTVLAFSASTSVLYHGILEVFWAHERSRNDIAKRDNDKHGDSMWDAHFGERDRRFRERDLFGGMSVARYRL